MNFPTESPGCAGVPLTQREDLVILLPPVRTAVATARRQVAAACRNWRMSALADTAELLSSELVTNAVIHGSGEVRMGVSRHGDRLRVEVSDDDPSPVQPRARGDAEESGRGLYIVASLASAWGCDAAGAGKTIWFELRNDGAR